MKKVPTSECITTRGPWSRWDGHRVGAREVPLGSAIWYASTEGRNYKWGEAEGPENLPVQIALRHLWQIIIY